MRKGVLIVVVLALFAARSLSGQSSPQTQPEEVGLFKAAEVAVPDLSKLYPIDAKKEFLIIRDRKDMWVHEVAYGDAQVFMEQSFAESKESDEAVAMALYPLDINEEKPCAIGWKMATADEDFTYAILLEDGRAVTTENARIRMGVVVGHARIFLYSGSDQNQTPLAERVFGITIIQ